MTINTKLISPVQIQNKANLSSYQYTMESKREMMANFPLLPVTMVLVLALSSLHLATSHPYSEAYSISGHQPGKGKYTAEIYGATFTQVPGNQPTKCDNKYYSDDEKVVALSTEWFLGRCLKNIRIHSKTRSVVAKVVDECDSIHGGCPRDILRATPAVWKALKIPYEELGHALVTWSYE